MRWLLRRLPLGWWRAFGRQSWIHFGLRERILRFVFPLGANPGAAMPDVPLDFTVDHAGGKFAGRIDSYIDWCVFFLGGYEYAVGSVLQGIARQRPAAEQCFWDVGANVGCHSLTLGRLVRTVHAFEPYGPVAAQLARNVRLNPDLDITIHQAGLADRAGNLPFFASRSENAGVGTFDADDVMTDKFPAGELPVATGDELVSRGEADPPTLIKIDVQGFEPLVLRGLAHVLARYRPIVVCEYSLQAVATAGGSPPLDWVPDGYRCCGIVGRGQRAHLVDFVPDGPIPNDILLFPRENGALIAATGLPGAGRIGPSDRAAFAGHTEEKIV